MRALTWADWAHVASLLVFGFVLIGLGGVLRAQRRVLRQLQAERLTWHRNARRCACRGVVLGSHRFVMHDGKGMMHTPSYCEPDLGLMKTLGDAQ